MTRFFAFCVVLLGCSSTSWAAIIFVDDPTGFNTAVASAGLGFAGLEDWESSNLAPSSITSVSDPLAPGVLNGPFLTGTNPATGLTAQSNTLGGMPNVPSPGSGLATASAGYFGTPDDQVSNSGPGSFDMIFGLANTTAVTFNPLVFDDAASGNAGTATIRIFDTSNVLIGSSIDVPVAGFMTPASFTSIGVVAMFGEDIGRINVFATSVDDNFSGADNINVYTGVVPDPNPPTGVVPEPSTIAIWSLLGLVGAGVQRRRRQRAA